jgi:O-antigen ligase
MVLLLWQFGNTAERVRGLCVAYVLGAGVCALLTIYEFTQSADGPYQRWAPEGFNPNNAALIMNLAIPLAWFLLVQSERRLERIAFLIVVVASVAAVILTGSRTGAIVLVVAMTYIFVGAEGKRAKIAAFVIIALTIGFTAQSAPVEIKGRLATIVLAISEGSMANRTTVWQLGLQEWVQVPFQGFGLASFSTVTAETFWGASAHNTFVSITVEQGLIGLLLFLLMIGVILWAIWRLPWATRALVLALFVMLALGLSTITWEMRKQFWLLLSILLMLGRAGIVGRLTPAHPASNRNEVFTLR